MIPEKFGYTPAPPSFTLEKSAFLSPLSPTLFGRLRNPLLGRRAHASSPASAPTSAQRLNRGIQTVAQEPTRRRRQLHSLARDDAKLAELQPELAPLIKQVQDRENELAEVQMAGSSRGVSQLMAASDRPKARLKRLNLEIEATIAPELRTITSQRGPGDQ